MSVYALVATIPVPERQRSVARLLAELATRQTRTVDGVLLVLDGYGDRPTPPCPLPVVYELRTSERMGAGHRWRAASLVDPEDILVCVDDDCVTLEAPRMIARLVSAVERSGASAAMGRTPGNCPAPPESFSMGMLIHGAGCGLSARAKHLAGVMAFGQQIFADGGPDCLGVGGDDDALVSAWLWKSEVPIEHAGTGNLFAAPHTQASSYTHSRPGLLGDEQKHALKRLTGWPWPCAPGKW